MPNSKTKTMCRLQTIVDEKCIDRFTLDEMIHKQTKVKELST